MNSLEKIQRIFEKYTTNYHFYLRDLRTGQEYELGEKKRYPICSCFKLAVLMAYFDSLKEVEQLNKEIIIDPVQFSPGGGVLNFFNTPVKFTYFQLTQMMMSFSDSTATDLLLEQVGIELVNDIIQKYCEDSSSNLSLGVMVSKFHEMIKTGSERTSSMYEAGNFLVNNNSFSNARDLAELALASYQKTYSLTINAAYHEVLKSRKYVPRTDMFFLKNIKFLGKTGSIGFGFFVNDCGVIEVDGVPIAAMGYTTEGWSIARELVEVVCGRVGIHVGALLNIASANERWTEGSERMLD